MLFDGIGVNFVEVHSHGPTSSEGVTADILSGVANVRRIQANGPSCILNCSADDSASDASGSARPVKVSGYDRCGTATL